MAKVVKFDAEARAAMIRGVNILACLLYTSDSADE